MKFNRHLTINETRELYDLPPLEGSVGDQPVEPVPPIPPPSPHPGLGMALLAAFWVLVVTIPGVAGGVHFVVHLGSVIFGYACP